MPGEIFVSYSHDSEQHRERVLLLAERLRQDGLDVKLDRYEDGTPDQGWTRWAVARIERATCVLVVCTETYYRRYRGEEGPEKGADLEGGLIDQELSSSRKAGKKFVPIGFTAKRRESIPERLRDFTYYDVTSEAGYQELLRFLRRQVVGAQAPLDPPVDLTAKSEAARSTDGHPPVRPSWFRWQVGSAVLAAVVALFYSPIRHWIGPGKPKQDGGPQGGFRPLSLPPAGPVDAVCAPGQERTEGSITYVRVCAGTFTMGSAAGDDMADPEEMPAHSVTLDEFWIAKTETTNGQLGKPHRYRAGDEELPATGLNWTEARASCIALGGRLPTEAEWEYAARAGTTTPWSFGEDAERLGSFAWYGDVQLSRAHPVRRKDSNAWGLFDMHGNVWEWVGDWGGAYPSSAVTNPKGPATGDDRVVRGGCAVDPPGLLRSAFRNAIAPSERSWTIGFRCVQDALKPPPS